MSLVERAAAFLDGLGYTGAQKRGAALALVDLMRSVVREEMAALSLPPVGVYGYDDPPLATPAAASPPVSGENDL